MAETTDTPTALPRVTLADVVPPIALGPLDGRYRSAVAPLVDHLCEAALNRERLLVEVEWLIHLTRTGVVPGAPRLSAPRRRTCAASSRRSAPTRSPGSARSRRSPCTTSRPSSTSSRAARRGARRARHGHRAARRPELVHFGCTCEDINNLSYALMVRGAVEDVWLPAARALVAQIGALAREHRDVPMLSRTHGQPATPTTLGKELAVLAHRLSRQLRRIEARRVPRQAQRRDRHLRRARRLGPAGRTGRRSPRRSSRAWA